MYAEHQPLIAAYAARGPFCHSNVARFVLATIRCGFPEAVAAYHTLMRTGKRKSIAYFGHKLDGLDWLDANEGPLFHSTQSGDRDILVANYAAIPGIGLVKAGFLAQLCHGVSGCIDTHNLVRFGMEYGQVRYPKNAKLAVRLGHVRRYNSVVDELGGTELLWNEWCAMGHTQGYGSAEEVSTMHLEVIV